MSDTRFPSNTGTPPSSDNGMDGNDMEFGPDMEVMQEIMDSNIAGKYIGLCKWFNNSYGYGFLTIWDGDERGKDIFVHHSGIQPMNSQYKTLKKGEYVTFDIGGGDKGQQAVNVRGICGGPLLCDHVQVKKINTGMDVMPPPPMHLPMTIPPHMAAQPAPPNAVWNMVSYNRRPRIPPVHPAIKRRRYETLGSGPFEHGTPMGNPWNVPNAPNAPNAPGFLGVPITEDTRETPQPVTDEPMDS